MSNYLIAIGGTGSKCVESIVHLCDCGYMPVDKLKVLIIDSDAHNGNKSRTIDLINAYCQCRSSVRYGNDTKLFQTDITTAFPSGTPYARNRQFAISPVLTEGGDMYTIKNDMVGPGNREAENLMKALYSREEYEKNITEGFYAHPSIGALMFTKWLTGSEEVGYMLKAIRDDAANENVNVFIIGSAFGGTGASGFPAVARLIEEGTRGLANRVCISGGFLLPYFSFERSQDGEKQIIDPTEFDINTKNALMFYKEQGLFSVYNPIYLIGDKNKESRGAYSDAGAGQKNWAHVAELYAGLAAADFYTRAKANENLSAGQTECLGTATVDERGGNVLWSDFPDGLNLQNDMQKFLMFNYAYSSVLLKFILEVKPEGSGVWNFKQPSSIVLKPFKEKFVRGIISKKLTEDLSTEPFSCLYNYLSSHARWLYQLTHTFTTATCADCPHGSCGQNHQGMVNCASEPIRRDLFGCKMLYRRGYQKDYILNNPSRKGMFDQMNDAVIDIFFDTESMPEGRKNRKTAATFYNEFDRITLGEHQTDELVKEFITKAYELA